MAGLYDVRRVYLPRLPPVASILRILSQHAYFVARGDDRVFRCSRGVSLINTIAVHGEQAVGGMYELYNLDG